MHTTPLEKPRRRPHPQRHSRAAPAVRGENDSLQHVGALRAHALAIAHEAAARYRELGEHFSDLGHERVGDFLLEMGTRQGARALRCMKQCLEGDLPVVEPRQYAWLDSGRPVREARAFVHRLMTPRLAVSVALRAEQRAQSFFDAVLSGTRDAGVRRLARSLSREQESHIDQLKGMLAALPAPYRPDELCPGMPLIGAER